MNKATGIEAMVCDLIAVRQGVGIAKYGTTLADNPAGRVERIQHALEEACDLAAYLQWELVRAKQAGKFNWGDYVRKKSRPGSAEYEGTVCGFYSTADTPEGYAVLSAFHKGTVQIYSASMLELVEGK